MVYDNNNANGVCAGAPPTQFQFCVTERNKVGASPQHDPPLTGTATEPFNSMGRVKLATQLQATLGTPIQSTMVGCAGGTGTPNNCPGSPFDEITAALAVPFRITLASEADRILFGASGELTISHQDTDAGGQLSEFMVYTYTAAGTCSGTLTVTQLCITDRNNNPNNVPSNHKETGYDQACTPNPNAALTCPHGGVTKVTKHADVAVKTNGTTGFFPSSPLLIYDLSSGGAISNTELVSQVRGAAAVKLTSPPGAAPSPSTTRRER
jgi:hypothetical protein